jgi:hypothetical protein
MMRRGQGYNLKANSLVRRKDEFLVFRRVLAGRIESSHPRRCPLIGHNSLFLPLLSESDVRLIADPLQILYEL